jgi:hypothetical protein
MMTTQDLFYFTFFGIFGGPAVGTWQPDQNFPGGVQGGNALPQIEKQFFSDFFYKFFFRYL